MIRAWISGSVIPRQDPKVWVDERTIFWRLMLCRRLVHDYERFREFVAAWIDVELLYIKPIGLA